MLEHHADLAADGFYVFQVIRQLNAVDDDLPLLMLLKPVQAADQG